MRVLLTMMALAAAPAMATEEGQRLYSLHCATCHGADANGKGPMAPVMTVQPANLTTLAARNDGIFPGWRVVSRLDGRDPLVAHGSDMPVFGPYFEGGEAVPMKLSTGQPVLTSAPIVELVTYLESIQQEEDE